MKSSLSFKNDQYKKNRAERALWLMLICKKCKNRVAVYKKEGAGVLKSLGNEKIVETKSASGKHLVCKKCKTFLGVKTIYAKNNLPAYRLFVGTDQQ